MRSRLWIRARSQGSGFAARWVGGLGRTSASCCRGLGRLSWRRWRRRGTLSPRRAGSLGLEYRRELMPAHTQIGWPICPLAPFPFFLIRKGTGCRRRTVLSKLILISFTPDIDDLYGLSRYGRDRDGHADQLAATFARVAVDVEGLWNHVFGFLSLRD